MLSLAVGLGAGLAPVALRHATPSIVVAQPVADQLAEIGAASADGGQPATRRSVKPALTVQSVPTEVSAAIGLMVSPANGCTQTVLGASTITAAHCHPAGFRVDGDVAWAGATPEWVDPSRIAAGATIYAVGYPRATPGQQSFSLTALGVRSVPIEGKSIDVLMTFGEGVPCTPGSSGMIAWVTLDNQMVPIGPMSVYSTNPAITGLPLGQYVCGFAV
jgi:hypothetical protein